MNLRRAASSELAFQGSREYALPVGEVWRLLADTEHMNRAFGVPAVAVDGSDGPISRARVRLVGPLEVRWREHPFEWVHERRWSVRRDFAGGPFRGVRIASALEPLPVDGGAARTRVTVSFTFEPRGIAGRLLAPHVGPRSVAKLLDYCDEFLLRRDAEQAEPLPPSRSTARADLARLDDGLARLRVATGGELLPRLRRRLSEASDERVLRMQPFAVADEWGVDRLQVLRLFLHATRAGLLELRWELMCPVCRVPKDEVGSLAQLPARFRCDTCGMDYDADFDRRVELRFSVHPAVREARHTVHCLGSPARTPHRLAQLPLAPGEVREVPLETGDVLELNALGAMAPVQLRPGSESGDGEGALRVAWSGERFVEEGSGRAPDGPLTFRPGAALRLANRSGAPLLAALERHAWDPLAATAAQVTALQDFRDLFSSEVLAAGQEIGVSSLAILFTDLKASTALYETVGDAPAFGRVNRHFEYLREHVVARDGTIVKTIGDSVMAAFRRLEDALAAALDAQAGIEAWCATRGIRPALVLKVGVHRGPVIAVNANDRLDYFGRTVNVAARLGRESVGGDVVVLEEVLAEKEVQAALAHRVGTAPEIERFHARLRGLVEEARLARVVVDASRTPGGT